jgi:hypothetical protein
MAKTKDKMDFDKRIEKLEIQINCLRKQVLDLEGKESYDRESPRGDIRATIQNRQWEKDHEC